MGDNVAIMGSLYVLLAESVLLDPEFLDLTVEGDPITVNRNYPVYRDEPILDEDGNPTGETRQVFDHWDIQQEQHPDLWGGIITFGFLEHPGLGPYYYTFLTSEQQTLLDLGQLRPVDVRYVADTLEFDQPIPDNWRGQLNVFLNK